MVQAGKATDAVIDEFAPLLEQGDVDHRRRQRALRRHPPPRGGAVASKGLNFVGMGVSGGEEGALNGPSHHAGRADGGLRRARPAARGHLGQGRRRALLHPHRRRRRGPLREDGPQRHRVRRHAAHRRGLRPAAQAAWAWTRPRSPRCSASWNEGRLDSYLIEITAEVLAHIDADDGQAVRRRRRRRGRAEGHRPLDGADRPRARRPGHAASPRPCSRGRCPATASCATPPAACPGPRAPPLEGAAAEAVRRRHRAGPLRLEDRRLRAGLQPDPGRRAPSTAGRSTWARSRRSGAAAASSAPASSTRSPPPTTATPHLPTLLADASFSEALADAQDSWRRVVAVGGAARHPGARVRHRAGLLRRAARRAPARRAHPGPARLLRGAHLPPHRPRGHLPHGVGHRGTRRERRRDGPVSGRPVSDRSLPPTASANASHRVRRPSG